MSWWEGEFMPVASGNRVHAKIRQNAERSLADYFDRHPIGAVLAEVDCRRWSGQPRILSAARTPPCFSVIASKP